MTKQPRLVEAAALSEAAECLRTLAHPVRLRIVDILLQGSFSVGRISQLCELPPHQTSEHLRLMQGRGLLSSRRQGRTVFYEVVNPSLPAIMSCIRSSCKRPAPTHGPGH